MASPDARYETLYRDAADPQRGNCTAAYIEFLPPGPPEAADLLESLGNAESTGAFAYLGSDALVHVLHQIRRHAVGTLGRAPSRFAGRTFAICDERTSAGPNFVEITEGLFHPHIATSVRPAADITTAFRMDEHAVQLAALDPAAGGDTITTRRCILIPHPYVHVLLEWGSQHPGGLTPGDLWDIVQVFTGEQSYSASYDPFADWARAAASDGIGGANPLQARGDWEPRFVGPDNSLGASRARMELLCFPPAPAAPANNVQAVVDALAQMRNDNITRRNDEALAKAAEAERKSSPASRWGQAAVQRLLNLCHVDLERELPPVYRDMVESGVKHDHRSLSAYISVEARDEDRRLNPYTSPVLSRALVACVGTLNFGNKRDILVGALVPFMVSYPDQESAAEASDINDMLDQHIETKVVLTMDDIEKLGKAQSTKLPKSWWQLRKTLVGAHRLQQVLLGDAHRVPREFRRFVQDLDAADTSLERRCAGNPVFCAQILRQLQLATWLWISEQETTDDRVPHPDYRRISNDIILGYWRPPDLPASLELPKSTGGAVRPPGAPTTPAGGGGDRWEPGAQVLLPQEQKTAAFNPTAPIATFIKAKLPGRTDDGKTMFCLSYHVKGSCVENCRRKADHRAHSASETKRLTEYLTEMSASQSA